MTEVRRVAHGSSEYAATVELRREILRRPLGLDFTPEQLASEAADVHLALFGADDIVACLILAPKDPTTLKMRQVAVREGQQGQGLGRRLVEASEDWARQNGFGKIILSARETAVKFYVSLAYDLEGGPFEEVGIPHRSMSKSLDNPSS